MNAFCHADFRIAGPILIKLFSGHLQISNNGGFIGGITPDNILHHQPAARNPLLVEALTRLRLVNRSNLGISRMFSSLLIEGKEPPVIREIGESVLVTFLQREFDADFRYFVAKESRKDRVLGIDELLLLQYLRQHPEVDTVTAAGICQRSEIEIREKLSSMAADGYLEHGGTGRGTYWCMSPNLYNSIAGDGNAEKRRRIDWEAAKTRVLSILMERARRNESGLSNEEIRHITRFDRNQARRLILQLMKENAEVVQEGKRRWARYAYRNAQSD